jgi:AAA domain/DnaB-like helicase N terminal domain
MTPYAQNAGTPRHALKIMKPHGAEPALASDLASEFTERAYLAVLIRNPDGAKLIADGMTVDHFTRHECREAFTAITLLMADGILPDAATLATLVDGTTMIEIETSLQENVSAANRSHYVTILQDYRLKRQLQEYRDNLIKATQAGRPASELRQITDDMDALQQGTPPIESGFTWVQDFCALPPKQSWLIRNYLEPDTLCVLFGDSQAYKSFLAIDWACHIATGQEWCGCQTKPGIVLYIAGEGGNGLRKRFRAWFEYHHEPMRNVAISTVPLALCDPANVTELIARIKALMAAMPGTPLLIVLDTLNTHFGDGDENSTADMRKFLNGIRQLRMATGATLLVVHHVGHADKGRIRGSISLHQGIDWEYRLERSTSTESQTTTLTCTKPKDAEKPAPLSWTLETVSLPWADEDGQPIHSAVLVPNDFIPAARPVKEKMGHQQRRALEILEELYRKQRQNLEDGGYDPETARVTIADWQNAMQDISADSSYRAKLRKWLTEHGHVHIESVFAYAVGGTGR